MTSSDVLIVTHVNPYVEVITVNPDAKVLTYSDAIRMWENDGKKTPDVKFLYDERGAYFIGTQKECNDFIKENNLTVLESDSDDILEA